MGAGLPRVSALRRTDLEFSNTMANTKSALKRARQTKVRTERNRAEKSRIKTLRKKTGELAAAGKKEEAEQVYRQLTSLVDKAAKKSLVHKNKAANVKSRTAKVLAAS